MFASAKKQARSDCVLLGAVIVAGVSVGILLALIAAKSYGVGSPSVSAESFDNASLGFGVMSPDVAQNDEQAAPDTQSAIGNNLPAFPGQDFPLPPTALNSQSLTPESAVTASGETLSSQDTPADPSQGIGEQDVASLDSTSVDETEGTVTTSPPLEEQVASPVIDPESPGTDDSVVNTAPTTPVAPLGPEPQLVGPTKLLPEVSGAVFLPEASELVGNSMFGDSTFDGGSVKEAARAVITDEWGDLSLAGAYIFGVANSLDVLGLYRSHIGQSDWMLYADVEGTSSALMFVLNNQTLVILTLEPRQMRLLGQESEGVALMLFNND
ncbi:MAG: hypothetical protein QF368_00580 [SAR202 cluster bacterium]|nr:hypothetical protein [SAR202 cluster bacterium]